MSPSIHLQSSGWRALCLTSILVFMAAKANAEPLTLRVAVASNFANTAASLFAQFEQQHNVSVSISSGSSGALYAQIVHGAPFDLFLSADAERPRELEVDELILAGTRYNYAIGQLALWDRELNAPTSVVNAQVLRRVLDNTRRLSIANPITAPYGNAAKTLLMSLQLWESVSPHLVKGNSVLQAYQFVETANVSRGLVAYHLVQSQHHSILIPQTLYPLLTQQMVILAKTRYPELSHQLQGFLRSERVQSRLVEQGYQHINIAQAFE